MNKYPGELIITDINDKKYSWVIEYKIIDPVTADGNLIVYNIELTLKQDGDLNG
jgi:hypothetical protein